MYSVRPFYHELIPLSNMCSRGHLCSNKGHSLPHFKGSLKIACSYFILCICSYVDGHERCFHVWDLVNHTAVNTGEQFMVFLNLVPAKFNLMELYSDSVATLRAEPQGPGPGALYDSRGLQSSWAGGSRGTIFSPLHFRKRSHCSIIFLCFWETTLLCFLPFESLFHLCKCDSSFSAGEGP